MHVQIYGGQGTMSLEIVMISLIVDVKVHYMYVQLYGGQGTMSLKIGMFSLIVDVKVHYVFMIVKELCHCKCKREN